MPIFRPAGLARSSWSTAFSNTSVIDVIITATTAPVLGALTDAQTPADAFTGGAYASTAGNITTPTVTYTINGSPATGADTLQAGDVVVATETVSDDAGTTPRPFSAVGVTVSSTLAFSGAPVTTAEVGAAYSFTPTTTGGTTPYVYDIASGALPAGLTLNASTGAITGDPTGAETASGIVLRVTDGAGTALTLDAFDLVVSEAALAAPIAAGAISDVAYTQDTGVQTVDVSGDFATGGAVASYSVSGGGTTISAAGVISIPTTALLAGATITYTGTNATGSDSAAFQATVNAAPAAGDLSIFYGADQTIAGPTTGDFFVDPINGSDAISRVGSEVDPFLTVQRAVDAAEADANAVSSIILRGGKYRQQATAGGTTKHIALHRYGTEVPRMTAQEPLTGWAQCVAGDAVEVGASFASIYKTTINLADLDHGGIHLLNLYENDVRCDIAQDRADDTFPHAPNDDKKFHTGTFNLNGSSEILSITDNVVMADYTEAAARDLIVGLYFGDNRAGETTFSEFDVSTNTGTLTLQTLTEHQSGAAGHRYSLINSARALKQGRWACRSDGNGTTATVYFWPNNVANLAANIEYTTREYVFDIGNAQGNISATGIHFIRSASDGTAGGGACFGSETSISAVKAGRVTLERCVIGENAGPPGSYGPAFMREVAGGVHMKNCTFRETNTHAAQFTDCGDCHIEQADFALVAGTTVRAFGCSEIMLTHSRGLDVARSTHANLFTMYLYNEKVLVWGLLVRDNGGYGTWQDSKQISTGFLDITATSAPDDDRAVADQNYKLIAPAGDQGTTYLLNSIFHPSREFGAIDSFTTGSTSSFPWEYLALNNVMYGLNDITPHLSAAERDSNIFTGVPTAQSVEAVKASEQYQAVEHFYADPFNVLDYTPAQGSLIRTKTPANLSIAIAALQNRHPNFAHFDKDIDGVQFSPSSPPMGPRVNIPVAPTPDVYPTAPVAFTPTTWMELQPQIGYQLADAFTGAMRWTWDGSTSPFLLVDAYDTYIRVLATSTPILRITVEGSNGADLHFQDVVLTGWTAGQESSFVWSVTRTTFQLWMDGTMVIDLTGLTDQGALQVPLRINAANESGLDAATFDLEAVWYSIEGSVDAATAAALLFDDSAVAGVYEPSQAMLDGDNISGLRASFFESRATAWSLLDGWVASAGNTAPVAANDTSSTDFETAVSLNVLANDTDADAGDTLSIDGTPTVTGGAAVGTVTNDGGGVLTFTPATGYDGVAVVNYFVTDGTDTDTATWSITVAAAPATYVQKLYDTGGDFFLQKIARNTPNAAIFEYSAWVNPQVANGTFNLWDNQFCDIRLAAGAFAILFRDSAVATVKNQASIAGVLPDGVLSHVYVGVDLTDPAAGIVEVRINGAVPTGLTEQTNIASSGLLYLSEFFGLFADVNGNSLADVNFGDVFINYGQARVGYSALYNGGTPPDLAPLVTAPFVRLGGGQTAAQIQSGQNLGSGVLQLGGGTLADV